MSELIRKSEAFWKTEWVREDYGDEGRGDYNHFEGKTAYRRFVAILERVIK